MKSHLDIDSCVLSHCSLHSQTTASYEAEEQITHQTFKFDPGWGDGALRHQLYNGLPARIKDELSCMGTPSTLSEYKILAQTIKSRYWEQKGEVA
jgi:hypothetical protein